jgi:hypothetical protein
LIMASTVIGASVEIEYKSIKDLKTALEETERQFKEMVDTFGEGSEEAMASQKKLASLQDGINEKTEQYNQKVDAAAATVSALNATVGGLQGALELTGLASEETEKALAKVTAALSIGDAIQNLTEFGPAIKQTFNTISAGAKTAFTTMKTVAVQAFTSIRGALIATGMGALVVALGTIVAYWDDIKAAISGVSAEQEKLNKKTKEDFEAQKNKLDAIKKQENILKLQGKTEEDILKMKIKELEILIKDGEGRLAITEATKESQIAIAKRSKDILQGIITFVTAPLSAVLKGIDAIGSAVGKNFDLYNKFTGGLSSLVFDPDQIENDAKEQESALTDLRNELAGYQLSIKDINAKASSAKTKEAKSSNDELLRIEQEAQEALLKSRMTAQELELFDLKKVYDEKKKVLEQGGKSTNALTEVYEKQKGEIEAKYKKEREEEEKKFQDIVTELVKRKQAERNLTEQETARQAIVDKYEKERKELMEQYPNNLALMILLKQNEQLELDAIDEEYKQKKLEKDAADALTEAANEELTFQQKLDKIKEREELAKSIVFKSKEDEIAFTKATSDAKLKIEKDELANKIAIEDAKLQATSQSLGAISNLVGVFAGESDRSARKVFQIQKALNISQAVVDTYAAANSIFRNAALNPSSVLFPAQPFIAAGIAITTGLANVAKIAKQKYQGASSGGGGATPPPPGLGGGTAPMQPTLSPAVQGQALNANAINNLGNQSLRAYVMNSDIQNNNQRNAYLERNARIG